MQDKNTEQLTHKACLNTRLQHGYDTAPTGVQGGHREASLRAADHIATCSSAIFGVVGSEMAMDLMDFKSLFVVPFCIVADLSAPYAIMGADEYDTKFDGVSTHMVFTPAICALEDADGNNCE